MAHAPKRGGGGGWGGGGTYARTHTHTHTHTRAHTHIQEDDSRFFGAAGVFRRLVHLSGGGAEEAAEREVAGRLRELKRELVNCFYAGAGVCVCAGGWVGEFARM